MTVIDKVIKQCFKDTANGFLMMIFGGLAMALCIAFFFTAIFVPVLIVLMIVGLYKVVTHLFDTSVYAEEAMFYQALPVSSEQIVVSRVFVGMVALTTFHLASNGSLLGGLAALGLGADMKKLILDISYTVYESKIFWVVVIVTYLAAVFLETTLAFILVTCTRTGKGKSSSSSNGTGMIVLLLILIRNFENILITAVVYFSQSNMHIYVFLVGLTVIFIALGCLLCKAIKKRLDNNLQL